MLTGVVENLVRVSVLVRAMRVGVAFVRMGVRESRLARAGQVVDELDCIRHCDERCTRKKWVPLSLPPALPYLWPSEVLSLHLGIFLIRRCGRRSGMLRAIRTSMRGPVVLSATDQVLIWGGIDDLWKTYA